MGHELFFAIFAGLGGMLGWGLADFFAKKTMDKIGDVATLAWAHVFGSLAIIAPLAYQILTSNKFEYFQLPADLITWGLLLFFGVLQAAVYLLVYSGFSKGQISLLSPIFASFSGFTAIFSIILFGEFVSGYVYIGLATLFIGILLINIDLQSFHLRHIKFHNLKGLKETIAATILAVLWTLLWNSFINGKDWVSYAFLMYIFMTLAILMVTKMRKIKLLPIPSYIWKFLILIGLCEIIAYQSISLGYSTTTYTSVVALLSGTFSLPTIFLARIFLKEKINFNQILGGFTIILGIIILSLL